MVYCSRLTNKNVALQRAKRFPWKTFNVEYFDSLFHFAAVIFLMNDWRALLQTDAVQFGRKKGGNSVFIFSQCGVVCSMKDTTFCNKSWWSSPHWVFSPVLHIYSLLAYIWVSYPSKKAIKGSVPWAHMLAKALDGKVQWRIRIGCSSVKEHPLE